MRDAFAILTEMNEQQLNIDPQIDLPKPVEPQTGNSVASSEQQQSRNVELGVSVPQPAMPQNDTGSGLPANTSQMPMSQSGMSAPVSASSGSSSALIADEVDLIEKEWVERAKRIVEHTKTDPYQQSEEVNSVKAEYQQKRFNRSIKPSDT